MGNSSSSSGRHHDESVDYGSLQPQGIYTGPRDWNQAVVTQLIVARKLAPFYRPLEEYEESWDDDQVLAARKELPQENPENNGDHPSRSGADAPSSSAAAGRSGHSSSSKRPTAAGKESFRPEAAIYRGATECPICFLYYPPNINHSRCCDQAICTECFVQIKRAEPTTTHLVSEPAACPYCVQDNFGIVYTPPPWRAGISADNAHPFTPTDVTRAQAQASVPTHKRRQKSYSADSPEVVTIDQIRPDWEAKLAAVRAAVARRANRRIIMRQVGDRLIPVGIGRMQTPEEAAAAASGEGQPTGGGRRRRRNDGGEGGQYVGVSGQDLEELMLMEAMRLSLIDHEEHQRREAEEKRKEDAERAASGGATSSASAQPEDSSALSSSTAPSQSTEVSPPSAPTSTSTSTSAASIPPTSTATSSSSLAAPSSGRARSRSTSRSRTPSNESPESRSPPAFSTLNAALLSSGTASAILNSSRPPIVSSTEPVTQTVTETEAGAGQTAAAAEGEVRIDGPPTSSST